MKSKTLLALAVASTFGWSAASIAGNGHEVSTPFSPNESGEVSFVKKEGFSSPSALTSTGSTSGSAGGDVTGFSLRFDPLMPSSGWTTSGLDDSLSAGEPGTYTEYWLVSFAPHEASGWDYYIIEPRTDELVSVDPVYYLMPSFDVVLVEDPTSDIRSGLGE